MMRGTLAMWVFVLMAFSIWLGMNAYAWIQLIHLTRLPSWLSWLGSTLIAALAVGFMAAMIGHRHAAMATQPFLPVAHFWLGVLFLIVVFFLAANALQLILTAAGVLANVDPITWARSAATAVLIIVAALSAYGHWQCLRSPEIKTIDVAVERPPFPELTIVQWSDNHFGYRSDGRLAEEIVARTNALKPDIVAITGDLVDAPIRDLRPIFERLRDLTPRIGTFFVTGNHDFYSDYPAWAGELAQYNITDISNRRITIEKDGAKFDIAGIHDPTGSRISPAYQENLETLLKSPGGSRPLVLLAHQPSAILKAAGFGVDLQLSGHTHGGQIWPFTWFVRLVQPYISGLNRHEGAQVYVSEGTGFWGPPIRIGTRAEIAFIRLQPAEKP